MDPYVGAIALYAFDYAPYDWAFCDGQLLLAKNYDALNSLLGTQFGGDGKVNFALPDLRGRTPIHLGTNTNNKTGIAGGAERVVLTTAQIPVHTHSLMAATTAATTAVPTNNSLAQGDFPFYASASNPLVSMAAGSIGISGGNRAHENRQPSLVLNFCIALTGIFPRRS